ncbi:hypothetical protein C5167_036055 [Papaver somniferum]|nr:hypothetical protein C5167_036055 [Papaver somniferum]
MGKFSKKSDDAPPALTSKSVAKAVAKANMYFFFFLKSNSSYASCSVLTHLLHLTGAYKTVVASHLSYSVNKSELIEFFKQAGEVVDARYRFEHCKGTCFVEFATEEAVNKVDFSACGWTIYLCNRDIKVRPLVAINGASKTLVAKNLSFSTTKSDVVELFKQAGEIVDVRFSLDHNGNFRGNCHIEFATAEAAMKLALLVKPYLSIFNTYLRFDQIQSSLVELFSTCGEISWMHIPTSRYTGIPRGLFDLMFNQRVLAWDFVETVLAQFILSGATQLTEVGGCWHRKRWKHLPSSFRKNKAEFGMNGRRLNINDMSSTGMEEDNLYEGFHYHGVCTGGVWKSNSQLLPPLSSAAKDLCVSLPQMLLCQVELVLFFKASDSTLVAPTTTLNFIANWPSSNYSGATKKLWSR